jgi:hypothetical protein
VAVVAVLGTALVAAGVVLASGDGELSGAVVDAQGAAIPSCAITPAGPTFHGREFGVQSRYDGRWSFGQVRNGPYVVRVICPDAFQAERAVGNSGVVLVRGDTHVSIVVHASG